MTTSAQALDIRHNIEVDLMDLIHGKFTGPRAFNVLVCKTVKGLLMNNTEKTHFKIILKTLNRKLTQKRQYFQYHAIL